MQVNTFHCSKDNKQKKYLFNNILMIKIRKLILRPKFSSNNKKIITLIKTILINAVVLVIHKHYKTLQNKNNNSFFLTLKIVLAITKN